MEGLESQLSLSESPSSAPATPADPITTYDPSTSPYVLLLAVIEIPSPPAPAPESDDDDENDTIPQPPAAIAPPRSTAKLYYLLSPLDTLEKSLRRTTILEFPTTHLISRAEFEMELKAGRLAVIEKPMAEIVMPLGASGFEGSRGGGRGRGGDRGRGGRGRGGRGGARGDNGGRESTIDSGERDNGWGKRARPVVEGSTGEEKKARLEE